MNPPASAPPPTVPERAHRPGQGRWLGGVCAELAARTGWMGVGGWRVLAVSALAIETQPTALLYVAAWFVLSRQAKARRARRQSLLPKVSWRMRWRLSRLGARVEAVRARHDPPFADAVQDTFGAIRLLAPRLQRPRTVRDERLADAALVRFAALLERVQGMAPDDLAPGSDVTRRTPGGVLLERLAALREELVQEATREIEAAVGGGGGDAAGREAQSLHDRIRPLAVRLRQSGAAASVPTLESIVARLEFLLGRIEEGPDGLDLRPFRVRRIAFEYLPQTLERYLQLSPELADRHPIAGGRTAAQSVQEQLALLERGLGELTRSYHEKDASGLLIHGRFLRDTFGQDALRLDDDPTGARSPPQAIASAPCAPGGDPGAPLGPPAPPAPSARRPDAVRTAV